MIIKRLFAGTVATFTLAGSLLAPAHAATCANPNRSAALSDATFVDLPVVAEAISLSGVTTLQIDLSSTGGLVSEKIVQSSGHGVLDDEALRSARLARFSPEIEDCKSVAGSYLYKVHFTTNPQ